MHFLFIRSCVGSYEENGRIMWHLINYFIHKFLNRFIFIILHDKVFSSDTVRSQRCKEIIALFWRTDNECDCFPDSLRQRITASNMPILRTISMCKTSYFNNFFLKNYKPISLCLNPKSSLRTWLRLWYLWNLR